MTSVWSRSKYFPKDSLALYCVNHAVWPSTFLMLCPPIHPQAQIILGKYHKREDFRIEVRLPSSSTNREKKAHASERTLFPPTAKLTCSEVAWPQCLIASMLTIHGEYSQMIANEITTSFKILLTFYLDFVLIRSAHAKLSISAWFKPTTVAIYKYILGVSKLTR